MSAEKKRRSKVIGSRWTAEEDEILRRYGATKTIPQIINILKKTVGSTRTDRGVEKRRLRLDPNWAIDSSRFIALHSISGLGALQNARNQRAIRKAREDGVLSLRAIRGRQMHVVPIKWADEWIAAEEANARKFDELRASGWYLTAEIAEEMQIKHSLCLNGLHHLRQRNGSWRVFRNVQYEKFTDQRYLWEPVGTRAAIKEFLRTRPDPRILAQMWLRTRVAKELGLHHTSLTGPSRWLLKLGFGELRTLRVPRGKIYWYPKEVIAFRERNFEALAAGRKQR